MQLFIQTRAAAKPFLSVFQDSVYMHRIIRSGEPSIPPHDPVSRQNSFNNAVQIDFTGSDPLWSFVHTGRVRLVDRHDPKQVAQDQYRNRIRISRLYYVTFCTMFYGLFCCLVFGTRPTPYERGSGSGSGSELQIRAYFLPPQLNNRKGCLFK